MHCNLERQLFKSKNNTDKLSFGNHVNSFTLGKVIDFDTPETQPSALRVTLYTSKVFSEALLIMNAFESGLQQT